MGNREGKEAKEVKEEVQRPWLLQGLCYHQPDTPVCCVVPVTPTLVITVLRTCWHRYAPISQTRQSCKGCQNGKLRDWSSWSCSRDSRLLTLLLLLLLLRLLPLLLRLLLGMNLRVGEDWLSGQGPRWHIWTHLDCCPDPLLLALWWEQGEREEQQMEEEIGTRRCGGGRLRRRRGACGWPST